MTLVKYGTLTGRAHTEKAHGYGELGLYTGLGDNNLALLASCLKEWKERHAGVVAGEIEGECFPAWPPVILGLRGEPGLIAGALNDNPRMISGLLSYLDPAGFSAALNANPGFRDGIVSSLNLSGLDPAASGALINNNASWLCSLLGQLNLVVMATVLVENLGFIVQVVNCMGNSVLGRLMDCLARGALGPWSSRPR